MVSRNTFVVPHMACFFFIPNNSGVCITHHSITPLSPTPNIADIINAIEQTISWHVLLLCSAVCTS